MLTLDLNLLITIKKQLLLIQKWYYYCLIIICLYCCYFKVANHHELSVSYNAWPGNSLGEHNDDPNNGYLTESMFPLV